MAGPKAPTPGRKRQPHPDRLVPAPSAPRDIVPAPDADVPTEVPAVVLDARTAWSCVTALTMDPRQSHRFPEVAARLGINPGALKALMTIHSRGSLSMGELAEEWRCDASMITQLVDVLEDAGFAQRVASPVDRRRKLVTLTRRGVRAQRDAMEELSVPPPAVEALSPADQATLARIMLKAIRLAEPPIVPSQSEPRSA